jgi:hypothetical protein
MSTLIPLGRCALLITEEHTNYDAQVAVLNPRSDMH